MRVTRVMLCLFFLAFFALLLSALIVTPAPEGPVTDEPVSSSGLNARLIPLALPAPEGSAGLPVRAQHGRAVCAVVLALSALCLPVFFRRDANGRVLRAQRYENSFYQLFRQEIAGG